MPAFPVHPDEYYANVDLYDSDNFKIVSNFLQKLTSNRHKIGFPLTARETWFGLKCAEQFFKTNYLSALKSVKGATSFVGDLHGNFPDVMNILDWNLLVVDEQYPGGYYRDDINLCFLGDYVDRGDESLRTIMTLMLFAIARPKQMTLLRGNHEVINSEYGLKEELDTEWNTELDKAHDIFELLNAIFGYFPILGKHEFGILMTHGGISKHLTSLSVISEIPLPIVKTRDIPVVHDILWSDPNGIDANSNRIAFWRDSIRGTSNYYNEGACKQISKNCDACLVIRAHEVLTFGIEVMFNGKLISLFSCTKYCGEPRVGTFIHIDEHQRVTVVQFIPSNYKLKKDDDKTLEFPSEEQQKMITNPPKQEEHGKVAKQPKQGEQEKKPGNRPKQDKPNRGLKNVITGVVGAAFIFCCVGYFRHSGEKETATKREAFQSINGSMFATMSAKLARVVNGISISQSITNGPFDEPKLIDELFSLGPNATLSKLSTSKVTNIGKELEAIQDVIGKECVGDDGCGLSTQLLNEVTSVQSAGKNVLEISKELSNVAANGLMNSINKLKTDDVLAKLVAQAEKMLQNIPTDDQFYSNFYDSAKATLPLSADVTNFINQLKLMSHQASTKTVDKTKVFDDYWSLVNTLKNSLNTEKGRIQKLSNVINSAESTQVKDTLSFLSQCKPLSENDKELSSGFPNGFDDVSKVLNDVNDEFLKELLNPGKDIQELSSILSPLQDFKNKLEPLHSSWKNVKQQSYSKVLRTVNHHLPSGLSEVTEITKPVSTAQECWDKMVIDQKLFNAFRNSVENYKTAATQMIAFEKSVSEAFKDPDSLLGSIVEISNAINSSYEQPAKLATSVKSVKTKVESTLTSLKKWDQQMKQLKLDSANATMGPLLTPEFKAAVKRESGRTSS